MKIAMVYDFGVNKGGGDLVMLNILEALASTKNDLTLVTSKPDGFRQANEIFGKNLYNLKIVTDQLPFFFVHPYSIAHMAKKLSNNTAYQLFILSDDVPKCLANRKVLCYMHYPHASSLKL